MLTLVYKDLYQLRRTMLAYAGSGLGLAIFFSTYFEVGALGFFIFAVYGLTLRSAYYEDKYNALVFLRTLPIKAESIVIAKYATTGIILVSAWFFTLAVTTFFRLTGAPLPPDLLSFYVGATVAITVIVSIFLVMFFRWGYNLAVTYIRFVFFGFFLIPFFVMRLQKSLWLQNLVVGFKEIASLTIFPYLLALATVGVFLLSMLFSLRVYTTRGVN